MKKRDIKRIAITFSFLLTALLPIQVMAKENEITKEIQIVVNDNKDAAKQAEKKFAQTIKEDGKEYELSDITYEKITTNYLDKKEKKMEFKQKPKETLQEDGVKYTLKYAEESEETVEASFEQTVTAYDDYDHAVTASDVPGTKTVMQKNQKTGADESVVCSLQNIMDAGTRIFDNTMSITFSNYDAAYYEWNGNYIPRNDEAPPLAGYEDQLLASVGAANGSEITGYSWSGDPYTADGVVYRDAVASVRRPVQMYRANYVGKISTPEKKEKVYKATYEAPDKDGKKEITFKATATYQKVEKSYVSYIVATGVAILLIVGLIVAILLLIAKSKKEKEKK